MADYPVALATDLAQRLARAFDVEAKIPRALDALAPMAARDVLLVDGPDAGGLRGTQLRDLGARLRGVTPASVLDGSLPAASADVIVTAWSWFREDLPADLAAAARLLRPGGRLLVVHDYGRDDVSRLRSPDLPEYTTWGRRDGWFLRTGFKVRVIHCWWTFETIDEATGFLAEAFGDAGRAVGAALKRPRLSYNVALYHWTRDGEEPA